MTRPIAAVASGGYLTEIVAIADNAAPGYEARIEAVVFSDGEWANRELVDEIAGRLAVPVLDDVGATDLPLALMSGTGGQRHAVAAGRELVTLVHRDATIGPWVELGEGSIVSPGARITGNVFVGRNCLVNTNVVLSHDDVIGDFVVLSPSATLCGGVRVGDRAAVFAGATVMPGVEIGADATVGAGSLVHRDVPAGATVAGVPARILGGRDA